MAFVSNSLQQTFPECDLKGKEPGEHNNRNLLISDPLKRMKVIEGTKESKILKLCSGCYKKALAKKQSQEGVECDLKGKEPGEHNNSGPLMSDPLKRTKVIEGTKESKILKLCKSCYNKSLGEKQSQEGVECDLKGKEPGEHNNRSLLISDPLKRMKVIEGTKESKILKLCSGCYKKALAKKQSQEGVECDLKGKEPVEHNNSGPLMSDPLKRTKVIEGTKESKILKLCKSCYNKSLGEKQSQEGVECDLKGKEPGEHNNSALLKVDPLKRMKVIEGTKQEKIFLLCMACYAKALGEKQTQQGRECDLKGKEPGEHNNSSYLKTDPLKRTRVIEATKEIKILKLCSGCYKKAIKEKKKTSAKETEDLGRAVSVEFSNEESNTSGLDILAEEASKLPASIKVEVSEDLDPDCHVTHKKRSEHTINNSYAILQYPKDPNKSLLIEKEGPIDSIKVANWGELKELDEDQKKAIKKEMKAWLHLNEENREAYEKKLNDLLEITIPVGFGPDRGRSVFAKREIKQYEVIGPYAGALINTEEEINQSIRSKGSIGVLSYLFATNSTKRSIDAFNRGNTISLINTGHLSPHPQWKSNNVAPVVFGKNLVFIVALESIKKGEELLFDYGPNYNPFQLIKEEDKP